MNSRIRELVNKSGCYECYGAPSDWDDGDYIVTPKEMEKLAQLIIRECADMFEGVYTDQCPGHRIDTTIKKHFGIE